MRLILFVLAAVVGLSANAEYQPGPLLTQMLDGKFAGCEEIVFATRVSGHDHWYVNFGYYSCDYGDGPKLNFGTYPDGESLRGYGDGGRLCKLNLRTGELTLLIDDPVGGVRDPQMHYDGQKVLFSYRKGRSATYHLYEINIDGTGLVQLTDGPDDDIEPTYLPSGDIMFCSSRCRRFVNCWFTRVATLYRCEGDGSNIRMVSSNNDHDNTPWVMPDGRVLYMRWEYVDRSQVHYHHLWVTNPDGTSQMIYYGNLHPGIAMLDAKPIPGTDKVVASFSPGHGIPEHLGYVTIVDPKAGPDVVSAVRQISKPKELVRDPYALSEDCILVANRRGIFVMNGQGEKERIYELPESLRHMECHEPRPIRSRPLEPKLAPQVDTTQTHGELVLTDVYNGRNMEGVKRGEIKKLLVLEQLPEPVHFSGGMEPISMGGTFTLARILGTVPVEPDGSAFMKLPALRSLILVALDDKDMSVKRMQSFVTLQPGERTSCVGCHEQRSQTASVSLDLAALDHPPHSITPESDVPDVFDYPRDIQPILNRRCIKCHNTDSRESGVDLSGDRTPLYTNSYFTMFTRNLVADGRNQPRSNLPPRSIGSSASRLMHFIDGSHHDVHLTERERKMIRLWIDSSAAFPGTYAALGSGMFPVSLPYGQLGKKCSTCHGSADVEGTAKPRLGGWIEKHICNLDHPEKSFLLRAPLAKSAGGFGSCGEGVFANTSDPVYIATLDAIKASAQRLQDEKRFDMPGFRPNRFYVREMKRFGILPSDFSDTDPIDAYEVDRAYWSSFWCK
ncbi:hypothetical protein [Planctomycetes bacterium CA13]